MEASSDENVARLNAEAEDRERDPNARRLIREIEALFAEARKTTEETRDAEETEETPAASGEKEKQETRKRTPRFPARAALRLLAELLSVEPENFEAAFQAAVLSLRENRTLDAIAYARRCLARAPGFARAADFLATCLETTQEGGDRSRGDDAHRARVRVGTESVSTESPAPSESEAELALAMAVMSNPESPDTWTAFARHLARRGLASDAVAALRDAPRRRAGGQVAKTALGRRAPHHAGVHAAPPRARRRAREPVRERGGAWGGDGHRDARGARRRRRRRRRRFARARRDARGVLGSRAGDGAAPGGFERGVRRAAVRGGGEETRRGGPALGRGGRGCRAPDALLGPRDWGPGRAALGGTRARLELHCGEETLFAGGRAAWLPKARRRAFEGAVRVCRARACPRVFACGSEAEALQRLANAGVGPATATAQRYVSASAPATRAGRGVTLRLFATLVGPGRRREANLAATWKEGVHGTASATERESVFFSPRFAEGFVIRAAPRWLDARDDDDADGDRDDADGTVRRLTTKKTSSSTSRAPPKRRRGRTARPSGSGSSMRARRPTTRAARWTGRARTPRRGAKPRRTSA